MQYFDQGSKAEGENREFIPLKNPLPQPPRRSHIRMEFDLTAPEERAIRDTLDDFELEISEEDDFDI